MAKIAYHYQAKRDEYELHFVIWSGGREEPEHVTWYHNGVELSGEPEELDEETVDFMYCNAEMRPGILPFKDCACENCNY